MASGDPIRIFVTHAWAANDDYQRVFEYLEGSRGFRYINCSAVEPVPGPPGSEPEREALRRQIAAAEAVIALATLINGHHQQLLFQLQCARGLKKPVLMLPAFGHELKLPLQYKGIANRELEWNDRSIVDAVRELARHELSGRWETIDFKPD
jgi:hypothetical protein